MTFAFDAPMPDHPIGQKHGNPKTEDSYRFFRSATGNRGVDVNAQVVWINPKRKTKASGCRIVALHGFTAAANGYEWIIDKITGRLREMTHAEKHRQIGAWSYEAVRRWRRGKSKSAAHPLTLAEVYAFFRAHGGTAVVELKARAFAIYGWIMEQAVETARRHNHAPWFKALSNMWGVARKAAFTVAAGGYFALIFGTHVKGRNARLAHGRAIISRWPAPVRDHPHVHIW